jgi:hypothetical protein
VPAEAEKWDFVGLTNCNWVDLPRFEELQAAPHLAKSGPELKARLGRYHQLKKDDLTLLPERAEQLAVLAGWMEGLLADAATAPLYGYLIKVAQSKAEYCQALATIYAEEWHLHENLSAYHTDDSRLSNSRWKPIVLTNGYYFWPEKGSYWGGYWMEGLDPCHRHQPHLYRHWQRLQEETGELPHFLLWLENFAVTAHSSWVRYFSCEQQKDLEIVVEDGQVTKLGGRKLSCPERQSFFFVIDLDEKIYACRAEPHICHSSFTRGAAVLASGSLQARDGNLCHIKFESGHYIAGPDEWWQAVQILLHKGISLASGIRITLYDRFRYISRVLKSESLLSRNEFFSQMGCSHYL